MKIEALLLFVPPPRPPKPTCFACKAGAPECWVPLPSALGGPQPMCWICAHHVVEHDMSPEHAHCGECEHTPAEIYPRSVLAARGQVWP